MCTLFDRLGAVIKAGYVGFCLCSEGGDKTERASVWALRASKGVFHCKYWVMYFLSHD